MTNASPNKVITAVLKLEKKDLIQIVDTMILPALLELSTMRIDKQVVEN